MKSEETRILSIVQKLLSLAEEAAEADLSDGRARQKWRREVLEQLDRIEAGHRSGIKPAELKHFLIKHGAWIIAAAEAIAHVLRSIHIVTH